MTNAIRIADVLTVIARAHAYHSRTPEWKAVLAELPTWVDNAIQDGSLEWRFGGVNQVLIGGQVGGKDEWLMREESGEIRVTGSEQKASDQ